MSALDPETLALLMVGAFYQLILGGLWLMGRWAFGRDDAWTWIVGLPAALVAPVVGCALLATAIRW